MKSDKMRAPCGRSDERRATRDEFAVRPLRGRDEGGRCLEGGGGSPPEKCGGAMRLARRARPTKAEGGTWADEGCTASCHLSLFTCHSFAGAPRPRKRWVHAARSESSPYQKRKGGGMGGRRVHRILSLVTFHLSLFRGRPAPAKAVGPCGSLGELALPKAEGGNMGGRRAHRKLVTRLYFAGATRPRNRC